MGREIQVVSLIFMLISGGTALFLTVMGIFPIALAMIFFFLLFLAMFVLNSGRSPVWVKVKPREEKKSRPKKVRRNERTMRYCSSCGFTGSQKNRDTVPVCPVCGHQLLVTDTPLSQFSAMTAEEQEAVKKTWSYLG
ncbi:MAG: hypothetical protein IJ237_11595 [Oscillospiraceae bacterium]|nr:hypothetical protein [Oscillospiraceae bacterium]